MPPDSLLAAVTRPDPPQGRIGKRQPEVAILLSTYNGEDFVTDQLDSFLMQTHENWMLHWRDDGSTDNTVARLAEFAAGPGMGRTQDHAGGGHLNLSMSFLTLLHQALDGPARLFAFADQDDIWLPEKLARGVAALSRVRPDGPALYCSAHIAVDDHLRPIGRSPVVRRPPGFPASLTQNVVQGCTMMLNRAAAELIASSRPPPGTWHDWWCYIVVTAAGGQVLVDPTPTLLYRQHSGNQVGNAGNLWQRGIAVIRRGRKPFVSVLRSHVQALSEQPFLLTDLSRRQLDIVAHGLHGGYQDRLAALRLPGFHRQTWAEDMIFRLWFVMG